MVGRRVGFDGFWLVNGPPSGRNVVESIIGTWASVRKDDQIEILVPSVPQVVAPGLQATNVHFVVTSPRIKNHALWVAMGLGSLVRYDVVLTQNFSPLRSRARRTGVFVHDLLFADNPGWFTKLELAYLSLIRVTASRADIIFTSSQAEVARMSRHWPFRRRAIVPTGLGVPVALSAAQPRRPPLMEPAQDFVLTVGRLNARKNVLRLLQAFHGSDFEKRGVVLVVVGSPNGKGVEPIPEELLESVVFLGSITNSELAWLYSRCKLFVFPSLDEGYGLPLLEAHHFGAQIASSNIPSFREINLSKHLFEPTDSDSIRNALNLASTTRVDDVWSDESPKWESVVGTMAASFEKGR